MNGLIAYGSLMSVAELDRQGIHRKDMYPVTVMAFRRSFIQEPSWRTGDGNKRGVLTVVHQEQASINAILVSDVPASTLSNLDERERGYDRVTVHKTQIRAFGDVRADATLENIFIYVGKPHNINESLEPGSEYVKLCLNAAREWGENFHEMFCKTTAVSGIPLNQYLGTET